MRSFFLLAVLSLTVLLFNPPSSQAVEIDFSAINGGIAGNLGTSTYVDPTGLTAVGYYWDGSSWVEANLYLRNDPNDHGIGVCSPADIDPNTGDCPGPEPGGDFNELDNADAQEIIVLTLPTGYEWSSVQISSLDTSGSPVERGVLYADNGDLTDGFGDVLEEFSGGVDPLEATFNIDPAFVNAATLVFVPFDHTDNGGTNNDFLVYKATIETSEGGQGCTPGYWKQPQHFDSWFVYTQDQLYDDVFQVTSTFDADTLLEVLKQGGGGEIALGRHAVAALLNSVNPDVSYEFTAAEIIAIVQDAYATGNFKAAKNLLQDQNELGCPLN